MSNFLASLISIPATNSNSKYRKKLTDNLSLELDSGSFKTGCKNYVNVTSRDRKLTFKNLIFIILNFKTAIQRELDSFFKSVSNQDFNIREVTKGAFSQARLKLNPWAFQRLNQIAVDSFYEDAQYRKWHGFRLLAVDGTHIVLPNHQSIVEEFGSHLLGPNLTVTKSMALGSLLYDVLNTITIDGQIDRYDASERDLLVKHLGKTKKGDLLLLDRGYGSFWLFFLLQAKEIHFCVRLKNDWNIVKEFKESNEQDQVISLKLPKKDFDKLAEYPEYQQKEIQCRLVKVTLETGEIEVLCTSLIDEKVYKLDEFKELYHYRWNEEEAYKLFKCRIELENFSGKTALAIKQDFHAKIFLMTLCATYAHPIEEKVIQEYKDDESRKFSQKINRTNAIGMTQSILIAVFIKKQFRKAIKAFDDIVSKTREIIRPNRSLPRKHKPKKPYSMNYKRL
jgi:Transposase DDE domain